MSNDQSKPSTPAPPNTPNQTGQHSSAQPVNGNGDRCESTSNNASDDHLNPTIIDDHLSEASAEEKRGWEDAMNDSRNN
jgi:hypothetical protein